MNGWMKEHGLYKRKRDGNIRVERQENERRERKRRTNLRKILPLLYLL